MTATPTLCSDRGALETYLRCYSHLNYYPLGDLDDFFWPDTRWYVSKTGENIQAVVLLYKGADPVVLLAILNENRKPLTGLLEALVPGLPDTVYAHLSPGLEQVFQTRYDLDHHGEHYKMTLTDPTALDKIEISEVIPLKVRDQSRLEALYASAYPGNWFNPRMLETGQYTGIQDDAGRLLSAGGIHVYSPAYRVAALGNITTLPEARGHGLATAVTAGLCKQLLKTVDLIGLNVRTDNLAAIRSYQKTGFEVVGIYNEWMLSIR